MKPNYAKSLSHYCNFCPDKKFYKREFGLFGKQNCHAKFHACKSIFKRFISQGSFHLGGFYGNQL